MEDLNMYWVCKSCFPLYPMDGVEIMCGSDYVEGGLIRINPDYHYILTIPSSNFLNFRISEMIYKYLRVSPSQIVLDDIVFDKVRAIELFLDSIYECDFVRINHGEKIPVEKLKEINLEDVDHLWII